VTSDLKFQQHPNPLAQHYSHFNVANRLLFTGHSHQAWPDCGLQGQIQAWKDAAEYVDKKWEYAEQKAELVRQGFARLLNDSSGDYALGQNTFDLVLRFLSALPLRRKPRIVTSDSEFHSLRRLLSRLSEEGLEVVIIAAQPVATFVERISAAVNDQTAAVCCSKVFYNTGLIVDNLKPLAQRCRQVNCELLIDAYHCVNVVPFFITEEGLEQAYIVGGGYKYCQLGEGNCFIRLPQHCTLRPIASGWYGEFNLLSQPTPQQTLYAEGPARFAGATYDPTSHYRAAKVFSFFQQQDLTPERLRALSQHQLGLLQDKFLTLDLDPNSVKLNPSIAISQRGGFITLESLHAEQLCSSLKEAGVLCDNRGQLLRFGPAPYLSDQQCIDAMEGLREAVGKV
jgi:kynureninase